MHLTCFAWPSSANVSIKSGTNWSIAGWRLNQKALIGWNDDDDADDDDDDYDDDDDDDDDDGNGNDDGPGPSTVLSVRRG